MFLFVRFSGDHIRFVAIGFSRMELIHTSKDADDKGESMKRLLVLIQFFILVTLGYSQSLDPNLVANYRPLPEMDEEKTILAYLKIYGPKYSSESFYRNYIAYKTNNSPEMNNEFKMREAMAKIRERLPLLVSALKWKNPYYIELEGTLGKYDFATGKYPIHPFDHYVYKEPYDSRCRPLIAPIQFFSNSGLESTNMNSSAIYLANAEDLIHWKVEESYAAKVLEMLGSDRRVYFRIYYSLLDKKVETNSSSNPVNAGIFAFAHKVEIYADKDLRIKLVTLDYAIESVPKMAQEANLEIRKINAPGGILLSAKRYPEVYGKWKVYDEIGDIWRHWDMRTDGSIRYSEKSPSTYTDPNSGTTYQRRNSNPYTQNCSAEMQQSYIEESRGIAFLKWKNCNNDVIPPGIAIDLKSMRLLYGAQLETFMIQEEAYASDYVKVLFSPLHNELSRTVVEHSKAMPKPTTDIVFAEEKDVPQANPEEPEASPAWRNLNMARSRRAAIVPGIPAAIILEPIRNSCQDCQTQSVKDITEILESSFWASKRMTNIHKGFLSSLQAKRTLEFEILDYQPITTKTKTTSGKVAVDYSILVRVGWSISGGEMPMQGTISVVGGSKIFIDDEKAAFEDMGKKLQRAFEELLFKNIPIVGAVVSATVRDRKGTLKKVVVDLSNGSIPESISFRSFDFLVFRKIDLIENPNIGDSHYVGRLTSGLQILAKDASSTIELKVELGADKIDECLNQKNDLVVVLVSKP